MLNATKNAAGFSVIVEQIVEKQIKRNYPPETAETYQRLVNDSFTDRNNFV